MAKKYKNMKKVDLLTLCNQREIKPGAKATKKDIVALLERSDRVKAGTGPFEGPNPSPTQTMPAIKPIEETVEDKEPVKTMTSGEMTVTKLKDGGYKVRVAKGVGARILQGRIYNEPKAENEWKDLCAIQPTGAPNIVITASKKVERLRLTNNEGVLETSKV
jgi:hypothetical protein